MKINSLVKRCLIFFLIFILTFSLLIPQQNYVQAEDNTITFNPVDGYEVQSFLKGQIWKLRDNGEVGGNMHIGPDPILDFANNYFTVSDDKDYIMELGYKVTKNNQSYIYIHRERLTGIELKNYTTAQMRTGLIKVTPDTSGVTLTNGKVRYISKYKKSGTVIGEYYSNSPSPALIQPQELAVNVVGYNKNTSTGYGLIKHLNVNQDTVVDFYTVKTNAVPLTFEKNGVKAPIEQFKLDRFIEMGHVYINTPNGLAQLFVTPGEQEIELQENKNDTPWTWTTGKQNYQEPTTIQFNDTVESSTAKTYKNYEDPFSGGYYLAVLPNLKSGDLIIKSIGDFFYGNGINLNNKLMNANTGEVVEESQDINFDKAHFQSVPEGTYTYEGVLTLPSGKTITSQSTITVSSETAMEPLWFSSPQYDSYTNLNDIEMRIETSSSKQYSVLLKKDGNVLSEKEVEGDGKFGSVVSFTLPEDGSYQVKADSLDGTQTETIHFTKDTSAPTKPNVSITTKNDKPHLQWVSSENTFYNVSVAKDGGAYEVVVRDLSTNEFTLEDATKGSTYKVKVEATDKAGNSVVSDEATYTYLDQTKPVLSVNSDAIKSDYGLLKLNESLPIQLTGTYGSGYTAQAKVEYVLDTGQVETQSITLQPKDTASKTDYISSFQIPEGTKMINKVSGVITAANGTKIYADDLLVQEYVGATLQGQIELEDTSQQATLKLTSNDQIYSIPIQDGSVNARGFPAGEYEYYFVYDENPFYGDNTVKLNQGSITPLPNTKLPSLQDVSLKVSNDNSQPIQDTYVQIKGAEWINQFMNLWGYTNEEGDLLDFSGDSVFESIPNGTYDVTVYGNGIYDEYQDTFEVDTTKDYVSNPILITLPTKTKNVTSVTIDVYGKDGNTIEDIDYGAFYSWDVEDQFGDGAGHHYFKNEPLQDGSLTVTDAVYDENYNLYINEEGYIPYNQTDIDITQSVTQHVYLEPGVNLSGQVQTNGGKLLTDAWVEVNHSHGSNYAQTNESGDFQLNGLSSQNASITVKADGYKSQTLSLDEADFANGVTVSLAPSNFISGKVLKQDGVTPEANVSLHLYNGEGQYIGLTRSSSDGSYTFTGMSEGNHSIKVDSFGYPNVKVENVSTNSNGNTIILQDNQVGAFTGEGNQMTSSTKSVTPGKTINYRLDYQNNSSQDKTNVKVQINISDQEVLNTNSFLLNGKEASINNNVLIIPSVQAGGAGTISFSSTVSGDANKAAITTASINQEKTVSATTNLLYATIQGPNVTSSKSIKVYGKAQPGSIVSVYDGDTKLTETVTEGRWWYADVQLPVTQNEVRSHQLTAKVVSGNVEFESMPLEVTYKPSVPKIKDVHVSAGWNKDINANPYTGIVTTSIVERTPIDVEIEFDEDVDQASVQFLGESYPLEKQGEMYIVTIPGTWSSFGEQLLELKYSKDSSEIITPLMEATILIDPSGYVFEGSMENPISGVTAVVEEEQSDSSWDAWDAHKFGQVNPQVTDEEGRYGWDVPAGNWRVTFTKNGYAPYISRKVNVPPPETQLNVPMVSWTTPQLESVSPREGATNIDIQPTIELTFDRPMNEANIQDQIKLVDQSGNEVSVTFNLEGMNGYKQSSSGYFEEDTSKKLSKVVAITPNSNLSTNSTYKVIVDKMLRDYDGKVLGSKETFTFTTGEGDKIQTPDTGTGSESETSYPVSNNHDDYAEDESHSNNDITSVNKTSMKHIKLKDQKENPFENLDVEDIVKYNVSNPEIVEIDDSGNLTVKGEGIVLITAEDYKGNKHNQYVVVSNGEINYWNEKKHNDNKKEWIITFNSEVSTTYMKDPYIQVINDQGEQVDVNVELEVQDQNKLVVAPQESYKEGQYYLYVSHNTPTKTHRKLKETIVMPFHIN